jgi:hypothetical protein
MKIRFVIYFVLCVLLIPEGCQKKEDNPVVSAAEIISWIKPIDFRGQNIFVENLTREADGGFLASGNISYQGKALTDGLVIKLNSEGDTAWCRKVSIDNYPNTDVLYAVRNQNNEIIVGGLCSYALFKKQKFVGWLDENGNLSRYVLFPLNDNQVVNGIKIIPVENGNFYFAVNGSKGADIEMLGYTLNIDLLDNEGKVIRNKVFTGINTLLDRLYPVNNGNLLLVGSVPKDSPDYADILFLMIDPSGNEKYRRSFGTAGYDVAYSACPDYKGGFITAGMTTNLAIPSVYPVNSSGVVSNRIVIDDNIFSNATIILQSVDGGYDLIIQSASNLYFKKLGVNLVEEENWVISNPNPAYDIRTAFAENDGSVTFLYNTNGPVIVRTIPLN